jgi:hypothetical protein
MEKGETNWVVAGIVVSVLLFVITAFSGINTALNNAKIENLENELKAETTARLAEEANFIQIYKDLQNEVKGLPAVEAEVRIVLDKLKLDGPQ